MHSLKSLNDRFGGLFIQPDEEDDDTDEEITTRIGERFGWVAVIDQLAHGDKTKWPYFENMNVVPFLQMVFFEKIKYDEYKARQRRDEIRRKARMK